MQRPLGPRSINRSASPLPVNVASPAPLPPGKSPRSPPGRPSLGGLSLSIPNSNRSPTPNPPKLTIAMPKDNVRSDDPDSPGGYYNPPRLQEITSNNTAHSEEMTIRPTPPGINIETVTTTSNNSSTGINDVKGLLESLPDVPPTQHWSDDALEELARLGEGAGGAVHKVRDKRTQRVMARKTITTREAPMRQLLRELSIISSTKHDNIVQFYGAYMSPSSSEVKILMDYCEGGSLESVGRRIKDRGAIVGELIAGRLAEGVLQGLAYLHSKKTIHRDIKPSNILLSKDGIVKLCDFGVSGELVDSLAGTFTGTSFYMAPERICGHEYTIRSDVWSTGISLLELVQNKFPFPNDLPPIELMMYITTGEPPQLEDENGIQWSDDMKDFIRLSLIVDSQTRPTPKEMLAHPWIVNVMKQEVQMAKWLRKVWNWPKAPSRQDGSRPGTASKDSDS